MPIFTPVASFMRPGASLLRTLHRQTGRQTDKHANIDSEFHNAPERTYFMEYLNFASGYRKHCDEMDTPPSFGGGYQVTLVMAT